MNEITILIKELQAEVAGLRDRMHRLEKCWLPHEDTITFIDLQESDDAIENKIKIKES